MKFKELWRASLRDLKAHPQKIAVLALLGGTALYFWVPLAKKWSNKQDAPPVNPQAMLAQIAAEAAVGKTGQAKPEPMPWNLVAEASNANPLTKPLTSLTLEHDPFAAVAPKPEKPPEISPPVDVAAQAAEELENLGLELSATSIGARSRAAIINGDAYHPGDLVEAAQGKEWKVVEIGPRHVVLLLGSRTITLQAPRTLADELRDRQAKVRPAQ